MPKETKFTMTKLKKLRTKIKKITNYPIYISFKDENITLSRFKTINEQELNEIKDLIGSKTYKIVWRGATTQIIFYN